MDGCRETAGETVVNISSKLIKMNHLQCWTINATFKVGGGPASNLFLQIDCMFVVFYCYFLTRAWIWIWFRASLPFISPFGLFFVVFFIQWAQQLNTTIIDELSTIKWINFGGIIYSVLRPCLFKKHIKYLLNSKYCPISAVLHESRLIIFWVISK